MRSTLSVYEVAVVTGSGSTTGSPLSALLILMSYWAASGYVFQVRVGVTEETVSPLVGLERTTGCPIWMSW